MSVSVNEEIDGKNMARRCSVSSKGVMYGNRVSHSNIKTRHRFLPNMKRFSLKSDILGLSIKMRLSTSGMRTIEHREGLDGYLISTPTTELSGEMMKLRKLLLKKAVEDKAATLAE